MELKTVFNTFSPAEANLVRGRLEAAGFEAYIQGELAGMSIGGYTAATGGIRIQVPEDRAADARALIESDLSQPSGETGEETPAS
jgi:hypothetical protein